MTPHRPADPHPASNPRAATPRAATPRAALWLMAGLIACKPAPSGVPPQRLADAVHAALESDRIIYTREVVNRLQNELGVIKASEHWKEDKTLPLPAQMFRMGAELTAQKEDGLHYALISSWPISRQNRPRTDAEKAGLDFVVQSPNQNYYGSERLGDTTYFTAVYPDKAIANACVECHNQHPSSPRHDFALGDVMGGVVVRIAQ